MQSVLITGGAGFIGQNLVHAWRAARPGDRLTVIDAMTYAANVRSLEPLIADRSIQFVKGDIGDPINNATKYVATNRPLTKDWNTVRLEGDVVDAIRKLKGGSGPELQVSGKKPT